MGGRGASSGFSIDKNGNIKNEYGTQYQTLFQEGNMLFIKKYSRQSETLMETMTSGRIYVEIGGNDILRIVQFGSDNKRSKVIEFDKRLHKWHVHKGYFHTENSGSDHDDLSSEDDKLLAKVLKIWQNRHKV